LFVTDILAEGTAAKEAGWQVVMASRPGNAPLPAGHGFKEVKDFAEEIF
jgi:methionine salvage enolase-phosphatase E1